MQEDDDLESKQRYLRVNIMEKGFDTDHFTMWMDKNFDKGNPLHESGCEIELWTLEELQEVVEEYQRIALEKLSKGEFSPLSPNSIFHNLQNSGSMSNSHSTNNTNPEYSSVASLSVGEVQFSTTVQEQRSKGVGVHIFVSE